MAKEPTKPLKVTARLIDGRVNSSDGLIMFDGILYHAWFAKHHPEVFETGQWMERGDGYVGLPLRQLPGNRWAASRGVYAETAQTVEHWNKRPNFFNPDKIGYLDITKGVISDSVGVYRAYRTPNIIRTVEDAVITFYCVGHEDGIADLLGYLPGVGKKLSMGYGLMRDWTIEDAADDYTLWHPDWGLMRPTPVGDMDLDGYAVSRFGIRPPYWKECNMAKCYVPDTSGFKKEYSAGGVEIIDGRKRPQGSGHQMNAAAKHSAWFAIGKYGGRVDKDLLDQVCGVIDGKYDDDYMQGLLARIVEAGLL